MASPKPVPPYFRVVKESAWLKELNMRPRTSSDIPIPVSMTSNRSKPSSPAVRTRTITSPESVNLMALPTKLMRIWRSRIGSPHTVPGTSRSTGTGQLQPLRMGSRGKDLEGLLRRIAQVRTDALELDLAGLDLRKVQDVVDDRREPPPNANRFRSGAAAGERGLLQQLVMPMTPFIGVRISWLMRARKSLLALLARSAASLARLASRSRASAPRLALPRLIVRSSTCCW